jgi:hypothetical protein
MLMGSFGQGVWGSANVHVAQTVLAVGQRWVANLPRLWPQDEHQAMYAISLLKHAVQMCTELLVQLLSVSLRRNLTGKPIELSVSTRRNLTGKLIESNDDVE